MLYYVRRGAVTGIAASVHLYLRLLLVGYIFVQCALSGAGLSTQSSEVCPNDKQNAPLFVLHELRFATCSNRCLWDVVDYIMQSKI